MHKYIRMCSVALTFTQWQDLQYPHIHTVCALLLLTAQVL